MKWSVIYVLKQTQKTVNDIKCSLGKKWCTDCELTINLEMTVKCPFCRKVISNTIQLPLLHLV